MEGVQTYIPVARSASLMALDPCNNYYLLQFILNDYEYYFMRLRHGLQPKQILTSCKPSIYIAKEQFSVCVCWFHKTKNVEIVHRTGLSHIKD